MSRMVHWPVLWQYVWMFVFVTLCPLFFPASCRAVGKLPRNPSKCCQIARSQQHAQTGPPEQLHKGKKPSHQNVLCLSFFPLLLQNRWNKRKEGWLTAQWSVKIDWLCPPTYTTSSAIVSPLTSPWSSPLGCCCQQAEPPRACQS